MRKQISRHTYITDRPNKKMAKAIEEAMSGRVAGNGCEKYKGLPPMQNSQRPVKSATPKEE